MQKIDAIILFLRNGDGALLSWELWRTVSRNAGQFRKSAWWCDGRLRFYILQVFQHSKQANFFLMITQIHQWLRERSKIENQNIV
jgi:hypothetical protein